MERKKVQLNFRFYNPNPAGVMERALERLLIDNGVEKVHSAICKTNFTCKKDKNRYNESKKNRAKEAGLCHSQ